MASNTSVPKIYSTSTYTSSDRSEVTAGSTREPGQLKDLVKTAGSSVSISLYSEKNNLRDLDTQRIIR